MYVVEFRRSSFGKLVLCALFSVPWGDSEVGFPFSAISN